MGGKNFTWPSCPDHSLLLREVREGIQVAAETGTMEEHSLLACLNMARFILLSYVTHNCLSRGALPLTVG